MIPAVADDYINEATEPDHEIGEEVQALKRLVAEKDVEVKKLTKRVKSSEEQMTSYIQVFQKRMEEMELKVEESRYPLCTYTASLTRKC